MRRLVRDARAPVAVCRRLWAGPAQGSCRQNDARDGQMVSPLTVADHYADLLDGFVLDWEDEALARP